jgi:hypothetical protein
MMGTDLKPLFLDPRQPLYTCKEENCDGCHISETLVCHFNGKQLGRFVLMFLPPFVLAGYAMFIWSLWAFIPWLAFIFLYFLLIEIRVMCSHCPHYAEPGLTSLKCWANYGAPKLWAYRPGPMSFLETFFFFLGFVLIFLTPALAYGLMNRWWLMGIYLMVITGTFVLLHFFYCKHCINFACPLNAVKKKDRADFLDKNPVVKDARDKK